MDALIDVLLDWIDQHSTYQTHSMPHPVVLALSPHELTLEYYTGVAHLIPSDGIDERLNALYAPGDGPHGTVYILAPQHIEHAADYDHPTDNPLFREILLHELVHHVQHHSGAALDWPCLSIGEAEAYRLGGTYLRHLKVDDPLPNRNFWGAIYSRC